jgi:hypothetical protein
MKIEQYVHGANREFVFDGERYLIEYLGNRGPNQDQWRYHLPSGVSHTHPTQFGAMLMCLKNLAGGQWDNLKGCI